MHKRPLTLWLHRFLPHSLSVWNHLLRLTAVATQASSPLLTKVRTPAFVFSRITLPLHVLSVRFSKIALFKIAAFLLRSLYPFDCLTFPSVAHCVIYHDTFLTTFTFCLTSVDSNLHVMGDLGLFLKVFIFMVPRTQSGPYFTLIKYLLDGDDMFDDKDEDRCIAIASTTFVIAYLIWGVRRRNECSLIFVKAKCKAKRGRQPELRPHWCYYIIMYHAHPSPLLDFGCHSGE